MAHTPGPWEMSGPDEMACVRTVREYIEMVADGSRPKKDSRGRDLPPYKVTIYQPFPIFWPPWSALSPEQVANARLIAAAPDLLAACKAARDILRIIGGANPLTMEQIDVAIAKAEGRVTAPLEQTP
jgi:hypothetical protein